MGLIEIEGIEFYSYHGHFKEEQIVGSRFLVNIAIETDLEKASKSDKLADTINYQSVYQLIKEEMETNSRLLEHVAGRIIDRTYLTFTNLIKVRVKVSKINPTMGGQIEKVSVTIER
jgi:7,8-dihydroneopterin aldolase/epimerase/oxygenase